MKDEICSCRRRKSELVTKGLVVVSWSGGVEENRNWGPLKFLKMGGFEK